jgi:hypothetical protein
MHAITTLAAIRAWKPCASGWRKLLATLGKTKADDEPLSFAVILESNGLNPRKAIAIARTVGPAANAARAAAAGAAEAPWSAVWAEEAGSWGGSPQIETQEEFFRTRFLNEDLNTCTPTPLADSPPECLPLE